MKKELYLEKIRTYCKENKVPLEEKEGKMMSRANMFFHYRPDILFTDEEIEKAKDVKIFKGGMEGKEGTVIELI